MLGMCRREDHQRLRSNQRQALEYRPAGHADIEKQDIDGSRVPEERRQRRHIFYFGHEQHRRILLEHASQRAPCERLVLGDRHTEQLRRSAHAGTRMVTRQP